MGHFPGWGNKMTDVPLKNMIEDIAARIHQNDPAHGKWCTNGHTYDVWVDANSLGTCVSLEIDGSVIEDECWIWPVNDPQHINLAKLDTILKGINLALQWSSTGLHHSRTPHVCIGWYRACSLAKSEYKGGK